MADPTPPIVPLAATIPEVISRMQSILASLPARDGVACFTRMYLEVTEAVNREVLQGGFQDAEFVKLLDVVFANLFFQAESSMSGQSGVPAAWQPLLSARSNPGIEPIQFALAGMNAHINYDLPLALVSTCQRLGGAPTDAPRHADYQKVDGLLDAAEQSVRESFEPKDVETIDAHIAAVSNLVCDWSINTARDVAWDTALALWEVRDLHVATDLLAGALSRTVGMASRTLLVAL
jgi:hypothetical protein